MPLAVTHVLVTIVLLDIFRDYIFKDKKKIPLFYIFLGGFAGLLPDIDIPIFWFLKYVLGLSIDSFHRVFLTSIFIPLILLILAYIFHKKNEKASILLSIFSFGITMHILLDFLIIGYVFPLYPISSVAVGLNLIPSQEIINGMDAILLLGWLWYISVKRKIKDFI